MKFVFDHNRSDWIRLVSFDYIRNNIIVSHSRDGISAHYVGRHGDGFTIVTGGSISSLRYPEISVWSIGIFPTFYEFCCSYLSQKFKGACSLQNTFLLWILFIILVVKA
jgi:hypothetical protein